MPDSPFDVLRIQAEEEAKILRNAPVVQQITGDVGRCGLCGRVVPRSELKPFDTHIPTQTPRVACSLCHPERS